MRVYTINWYALIFNIRRVKKTKEEKELWKDTRKRFLKIIKEKRFSH